MLSPPNQPSRTSPCFRTRLWQRAFAMPLPAALIRRSIWS